MFLHCHYRSGYRCIKRYEDIIHVYVYMCICLFINIEKSQIVTTSIYVHPFCKPLQLTLHGCEKPQHNLFPVVIKTLNSFSVYQLKQIILQSFIDGKNLPFSIPIVSRVPTPTPKNKSRQNFLILIDNILTLFPGLENLIQ